MYKEGNESSITETKPLKQIEKAGETFGLSWTGKQQETFSWPGHYVVPDNAMEKKNQQNKAT